MCLCVCLCVFVCVCVRLCVFLWFFKFNCVLFFIDLVPPPPPPPPPSLAPVEPRNGLGNARRGLEMTRRWPYSCRPSPAIAASKGMSILRP